MDRYRRRLLNKKLEYDYDTIIKLFIDDIPKTRIKAFKNQLVAKLNGAFRWGMNEDDKFKSITSLPTDAQVKDWFDENIEKDCSASSAIYKFRIWLKQRERK